MVFSPGMPKRSHRVTSALFLMVRNLRAHIIHTFRILALLRIIKVFLLVPKGLRMIYVRFFTPAHFLMVRNALIAKLEQTKMLSQTSPQAKRHKPSLLSTIFSSFGYFNFFQLFSLLSTIFTSFNYFHFF